MHTLCVSLRLQHVTHQLAADHDLTAEVLIACICHPLLQVPDLPPDVISVLLQHVSPKDRLTSCAFVCKAWHEACCSSIDNMTLTCSRQAKAHNAFKWLAKRGKNTITVHMTVAEAAEKLCLDCHLQEWSWVKDLRLTGTQLNMTRIAGPWVVCAGGGGVSCVQGAVLC